MYFLQVKIWFQNRRMKWRNSKERELLANGGSRDQTLPNKNNPNPDLSDARTDRQPSLSPASPSPTSSILEQSQSAQSLEHFSSSTIGNSGASNVTTNKPNIDQLNKFELHKNNVIMSNGSSGKDVKLFKMEYEEARSGQPPKQQQQLFNSFYDKVRDINNSIAFNNRAQNAGLNVSGGSGNNITNYYYDEYDSNSDSDEEISVT